MHSTDSHFTQEVRDARKIYLWKHANLSSAPIEVSAEKKGAEAENPPATVELSSFASWNDVARWYAALEKNRSTATPEIRAKVLELTSHATTTSAKIQALYDYVSKNIRYVSLPFGLGRYQSHTVAEVLANQYGDSKDKHTLLAAMLAVIGVHAEAALIPSAHKLDVQIPSPTQFDHLITAIPSPADPPRSHGSTPLPK